MKSAHKAGKVGRENRDDLLLKVCIRLMEFAAHHPLDKLLQYTLDELCACNGSPISFFHVVEPDQKSLSLQAWSTTTLPSLYSDQAQGSHCPISRFGIWQDAIEQQTAVIQNNQTDLLQNKGLNRELIVPVVRNDLVVALLGVGNKPIPYDDHDVRELTILADVVWTIASQKRSEHALAESEELFRLLVEHSPMYTYIKNEQLRIVNVSRNFEQLLEKPLDQIIGRLSEELFPPDSAQKFRHNDLAVLASGQVMEYEEEIQGRFFHSIKFPLTLGDRSYLAGHSMDITERRQGQQALYQSEEHFRAFFENATVGMATTDCSLRFTSANSALCQILGYSREELLNSTWSELTHPDDLAAELALFDRTVSGAVNDTVTQKRYRRKDGATVHTMNTVRCLRKPDNSIKYFIVLVEDISARVATEKELNGIRQQMLQQDKMASIGLLASGIAHEINNPMGFITSNITTLKKYWERLETYLEALEQKVQATSGEEAMARITSQRVGLKITQIRKELPQLLKESCDGTARIKTIINDLKRYVRTDEQSRMEPADLNQCIRSVVTIVNNEIKYVASLTLDLGEIVSVICNPQQISQVLMNLLINAAHSLVGQGDITVRSWSDSAMVHISVRDSGCGIPREQISRIFEPFFTTKEIGKGTGLGLSISHDIVKLHGGTIQVESSVGVGSLFILSLPVNGPAQPGIES
jgi:PAS domain S-box-containing protein